MAIISQGHGDPSCVLQIMKKFLKFGQVRRKHEEGNRKKELRKEGIQERGPKERVV